MIYQSSFKTCQNDIQDQVLSLLESRQSSLQRSYVIELLTLNAKWSKSKPSFHYAYHANTRGPCPFSKTQASSCDCLALKALMMSRTHSEHTTHPHTDHTEHPHHLNHHFTTQEPTTTSTITPAPKTTQELCDILCAMQQGGDACHCLKPGLPGRK
uniref:Uncharacterized protein n=1 Tax=Magallana gigas TaxID=29159 RepID=A0A8W8NHF9_MAGGI